MVALGNRARQKLVTVGHGNHISIKWKFNFDLTTRKRDDDCLELSVWRKSYDRDFVYMSSNNI